MILGNAKLSVKLITGFSVVALLCIVVGIIALTSESKLGKTIESVGEVHLPSVQYVLTMNEAFSTIKAGERSLSNYSITADIKEQEINRTKDAMARIDTAAGMYDKITKSKEADAIWTNIKEIRKLWEGQHVELLNDIDAFQKALAAQDPSTNEKYLKMYNQAFTTNQKSFSVLAKLLTDLSNLHKKLAQEEEANALSTLNTSRVIMIVITIASFVVAILLGMFISVNVIQKPLKEFIKVFKQVSAGDLTVRAEVKSKDEIGELSNYLNELVVSIREQIKGILDKTNIINSASKGLLNISDESLSASNELLSKTHDAASSSEQISANISTVSSSSEEMVSSVREIAKNTTTAAKITKEATDKANSASIVMNRLGTSSTEIGNIVKVITTIAEQTNLLALNATIEAARAGEAGKGFAVVANEVKDLAKETAKATEDITNKIKMIQDDSSNAINVIKEIMDITSQVSDISNSIASAIEEQSVTSSEINRNLNEASRETTTVAESNLAISGTVNEYVKISSRVKESATDLQNLANELETRLKDNFRV